MRSERIPQPDRALLQDGGAARSGELRPVQYSRLPFERLDLLVFEEVE